MKKPKIRITYNMNKLCINIDDRSLQIKFEYPISDIKIFLECVIVIIDPPTNIIMNENIYAISFNGDTIWQVEKIEHMDLNSPYTGIAEDNNSLSAYNWDGFDYLIDIRNGSIINKKYVK